MGGDLTGGSTDYDNGAIITNTDSTNLLAVHDTHIPDIIGAAGTKAQRRWVEFFLAELTNDNTRHAYSRATGEFFAWLHDECGLGDGAGDLKAIRSEHVAAYREVLVKLPRPARAKGGIIVDRKRSTPTVKLKLAAIRSLFRYLKEGGILDEDPAASVRAPKHSVQVGKTPVLDGNEAARILDTLTRAIEKKPDDLVALRDRALIALMTFTLARISAAAGMTVGDVKTIGNRRHVELHEKGGKLHVMPCHHELEDYLVAYIDAAKLWDEPSKPLFRATSAEQRKDRGRQERENKWRAKEGLQPLPSEQLTPVLGGDALTRMKAWEMVQRRAKAAGISTAACNHTFRATGLTTFLENGGAIEKARDMAAHASIRTTQLYDRRSKVVRMDDVVLIKLRKDTL
jgi:site-specific recombinase XerD